MSERMNKEQAIEQIRNIKEYIINPHQAEPQSMVFKQTQRENRLQALDIAIESLDNEQNIEQIKEKLLEKFKEHCYPVTQKDNSIECGMTLTGITQVLNEVFSNIESLDNEWVDVRDRLPSESGWYWVTQKFDFKGEFEYQNETDYEVDKEWFDSTKNEFDFTHKYIIAWRTYEPEPYKRKE
jgi:hypothetical protein